MQFVCHLAFLRHLQQKWNSLAHADYGGSSSPRHSFVSYETHCECYSFSPTSNEPWLEWIRHHSGGMLWTSACLRYTTAPWLPPWFPYFRNLSYNVRRRDSSKRKVVLTRLGLILDTPTDIYGHARHFLMHVMSDITIFDAEVTSSSLFRGITCIMSILILHVKVSWDVKFRSEKFLIQYAYPIIYLLEAQLNDIVLRGSLLRTQLLR